MSDFVVEKSMLKSVVVEVVVGIEIVFDEADAIVVEAAGAALRPSVLRRRGPLGEYSLFRPSLMPKLTVILEYVPLHSIRRDESTASRLSS
jgi:hypothetical protein